MKLKQWIIMNWIINILEMFLSSISMKLKIFNNIWIEFLLIIDRQRFGRKMIYFILENVLNINKKLFDNKN